jgi:NAD(P) transhydrogenase subunit alpha
MLIGVPRQTAPHERRVAITPDTIGRLAGEGLGVVVETGAGEEAGFADDAYREAGAEIAPDPAGAWGADIVASVRSPDDGQLPWLRQGAALLALLEPLDQPERMVRLAATRASGFAFETVPRTTRAQTMDVLSSQATAAGYQAVLIAATSLRKFFPMLTTAAGTIPPSKVLVLGAGVAGLQAIATARRLGAQVSAFDVRAAAREQVESLGARFIELGITPQTAEAEGGYARELETSAETKLLAELRQHVAGHDVVITTARVPGKEAPTLITFDMVQLMRPGSVIVDLAAAGGGNCELTVPDDVVVEHGVEIHGPTNLESMVARDASQMFSRNTAALVAHLVVKGELVVDLDDEITAGACITHGGSVVNARVRQILGAG